MSDVIEIKTIAGEAVEIITEGPQGAPGVGVPTGGSALQVLRKKSGTDYDTEWAAAGSGSGSVTSVALASSHLTITGSPITDSGTITANLSSGTLASLALADSAMQPGDAPSAHASSHFTAGADPISPADIGAHGAFTSENLLLTASVTLSSARAKIWYIAEQAGNASFEITLPSSGNIAGDILHLRDGGILGTSTITVKRSNGAPFGSLRSPSDGYRPRDFINIDGTANGWQIVTVSYHNHSAGDITSGTLLHERGGLEADVSAYNGLVKIASGSTSAVTVTSAGEALLDDADAAAQRTTLGLGNSATLDTGTTAGTVAAGDHTHELNALDATGATDGHVLTADGAGGAAFEAIPAVALNDLSNVSAATPSDNDVLVYDNATSTWVAEAPAAGGIGGSTGSTDNAILRADGTGGSTAQAADIVIDDATTSTQANVTIKNNHSETNSALVLTPKGTGAFIVGPKPDGTATGGNARGAQAVDLQYVRTVATEIASGQQSCILGGERNTASGTESCVAGGFLNVASGSWSFATGNSNTASGVLAATFGTGNTASASETFITGRNGVADRGYAIFNSSGWFGSAGDAQAIVVVVLRAKSTSSTAIELFNGFNGDQRFTIPSGKVVSCLINITAATSGGEHANQYVRAVMIGNRGGTTALRGAVKDISTEEQVSGADVTVEANDTNDAIKISFTGPTPVTGCTAEADDDVISKTAHGFNNNDDIVFTSLTGGAGLTANTVTYWVIDVTADTFKVSATRGGGAVNITTDYSDMTATRVMRVVASLSAAEVRFGT